MGSRSSRVSIERKILTTILVVGILPMAVALTFGYIAARSVQSSSVRQTLLITAEEAAEGLRLLSEQRLAEAGRLSADPSFTEFFSARPQDVSSRERLLPAIDARLDQWSNAGNAGPSVISLYDAQGVLIASSHRELAQPLLDDEFRTQTTQPRHAGYSALTLPGMGLHLASLTAAPILDPAATAPAIGYLTIVGSVNHMLTFALGKRMDGTDLLTESDFFQIIYLGEDGTKVAVYADDREDAPIPFGINPEPDPKLLELIESPGSPSLLLNGFRATPTAKPEDVMLAFRETVNMMGEDGRVILVVFRRVSDMFSKLNSDSILALVGGVVFIAFLCVNAYREVHNNIVRPISLLNDGAQIVQHGDFDLKLKIGTGDEIEELATSFNRMAAALKKNIKQLGESEERYRSLVTSMRDGIFQTDVNSKITFMNPAGVSILGFPSMDKAVGTELRTLFEEPISFDPRSDGFDEAVSGDRSRLWMKTCDARRICVELFRTPDYDAKGQAIGVEGTFRDVTEGVRLEREALLRAERISAINQIANVINSSLEAGRLYESLIAELRRLVDCDYAAVALLSEDNRTFEGRQLWPDEEVKPGYIFTLDLNRSSAGWVARERKLLLLDNLNEGPSPFRLEFPDAVRSCCCMPLYATGRIIGTLNLGSYRIAAFSKEDIDGLERMAPHIAVAIRNAQLLVNLQLSLEEVTRAREKLHEANEELKTLDEMKTNLLSNVSHELRTPLVAVMGYSDMILNGKAGPINTTQREFLEISLRNIEKLVTLIENLLDFSRLHRGDERLVFDTFDLADCVRGSMQIVQPLAGTRNVQLVFISPDGAIPVDGDKGKMGQVFNNLIHNAVKFNHDGGNVTIELRLGDDYVEATVSDTGIGMPAEACEKVFTRFYQYDGSSTRKYGGTGIGLSIAQDIVRLHGGTISVTSEEGRGSVFRFRLKLTGVKQRGDRTGAHALPDPEETHTLVEVVTEDRSLSLQIRTLLANERIDVIHASALENAVALAEKYSPDCVLVDLNNREEGERILQALLELPAAGRPPIVILTNEEDLRMTYSHLIAGRVKRSFRKSSLLSGIHHAMSARMPVREPVGDKVLCVDDDLELLEFMVRCLEAEGFIVTRCNSGEAALDYAETKDYGLILLDIAMPGMDGLETCKRIRENPALAGVKIYMVTAKPIEQNLSKIHEVGADGFLLKPFRPEDLVELAQGLALGQAAK